jgi:hypothetical protein
LHFHAGRAAEGFGAEVAWLARDGIG